MEETTTDIKDPNAEVVPKEEPEKEGVGGIIGITIIILVVIAAACYFYVEREQAIKTNQAASIEAQTEFENEVNSYLENASSTPIDNSLNKATSAISK